MAGTARCSTVAIAQLADARLERLRTEHQMLRQTEITEELLDVISGFGVLRTE